MEEELVKLSEYEIDSYLVKKCIEEEREITKKDVEGRIQEVLRGNNIECKTKLKEGWLPEVSKHAKYKMYAEVYVYKEDYEKAKELLKDI